MYKRQVVYIERNKTIVDREVILEESHIEDILESGANTILIHADGEDAEEFAIIHNTLQKDQCNNEVEAIYYTYRQLRNSEPPDESTARDVIDKLFFSDKRYDLGEVGRYRLNRKLNLDTSTDVRVPVSYTHLDVYKRQMDVGKAVQEVKAGKIDFKVDKQGIIHAAIGKVSFDAQKIAENAVEMLNTIIKLKPQALKGTYVRSIYLSSTMGPGISVDSKSISAVE